MKDEEIIVILVDEMSIYSKSHTLEEISIKMGITKQWVGDILKRSLKKLSKKKNLKSLLFDFKDRELKPYLNCSSSKFSKNDIQDG